MNRFVSASKFHRVYKSETIECQDCCYLWNAIDIETHMLCNDNEDDEILIQLYGYVMSGDHHLKAEMVVTNKQLIASKGKMTLDGGKGCTLEVSDYTCESKLTFLNFIFGGTEIGINVAIDFSYSIGP